MRCAFGPPKGFPTYYQRSCLEIVLLGRVRFCCGAVVLPKFGLGETPGIAARGRKGLVAMWPMGVCSA